MTLTPTEYIWTAMEGKSLVSCIIIFYNAEKYFEEAIESVLNQNYEYWELLLCDDGSSDSSSEIAKRYAHKYPGQIRYFDHDEHINKGMSATRNLGVKHASGEFVAFLDADDVWLTNKLSDQVSIMQSNPRVGMIYGRSLYWQSWSNESDSEKIDYIPDAYVEGDKIYEPPRLLAMCYPLGKATPPPPTDILLRKSAITNVGGFEAGFNKMYQLYEDQAFFTKLYLKYPVYVSTKCWDQYRLHPESCVSTVNEAGQYDQVRFFFLQWFEDHLKKELISDPMINKSLKTAFLPYRHPYRFKVKKTLNRVKRFSKKLLNFS